jgi:integrase
MRIRFTDLAIGKLANPKDGKERYWDELTPSFGLSVTKYAKSFIIFYGQPRRSKTIGKYPSISLADARKEAKRLLANQSTRKRSMTLSEAREAYLDECRERIRPATIRQYARCLGYLNTNPDIREIKRADLAPYLSIPHTTITWKTFFNWCIRNDLVDRNPIIGERIPKNTPRSRVLTSRELKAIWNYEDPPFSNILKLCILTGQRRGELTAIQSEWITDVITFPATVTKNKHEHVLPYGNLTKQYLKPYSFNGWSKSKKRLDDAINIPSWTIHDLRRTMATIHAEIGTPVHVTERLLNHVSGTHGGIVGIYQRHTYLPEMIKAVETYEAHIAKIILL